MYTQNLNAFPDDFIQVPDFEFPTTSGVPGNVRLGILPSRSLLIASERGVLLSGSDFLNLAIHTIDEYKIDPEKMIIFCHRGNDIFMVDFSRPRPFLRLFHLFSIPGSELTPANLRQLVGMLPE